MLGLIFLIICVLYLGSALAGWWFARSGRVDLGKLVRTQRSLTDPLTSRFQRWHDRVKIERLRRKQWLGCWFLISANNLLAVVFHYSAERSCHFAIVVIEESAEPFAPGDPA